MFLHRVLHQREADWPATAVEPRIYRPQDPLWEDARLPEKLDTEWQN